MSQSPAGDKPIHFVQTPDALGHAVADLSRQEEIAFDLEFDSHSYAYGVNLCLIQAGTADTCYVVDPFAPIDPGPLYAVFEDPRIVKIVHAPGEDLRLLHSLGCFPKNLFDTQVTAALLNYEKNSLAAIIEDRIGHVISKKMQRSNWMQRPLTAEQIAYAAADVAWLHQLKAILSAEAEQKGLTGYVAEEQDALSTTVYRQEERSTFLKPADLRILSPFDAHLLNGLLKLRDDAARELNKPAYQVLPEDPLRDLARDAIAPADLIGGPGVHRSLRNNSFIKKLESALDDLEEEAREMGLSTDPPPRIRQTREQQLLRDQANLDKEKKFAPIQAALSARFGEFAGRFVLSNALVNDILMGTTTISTLKRNYKKDLIREIAAEKGIDLRRYE